MTFSNRFLDNVWWFYGPKTVRYSNVCFKGINIKLALCECRRVHFISLIGKIFSQTSHADKIVKIGSHPFQNDTALRVGHVCPLRMQVRAFPNFNCLNFPPRGPSWTIDCMWQTLDPLSTSWFTHEVTWAMKKTHSPEVGHEKCNMRWRMITPHPI